MTIMGRATPMYSKKMNIEVPIGLLFFFFLRPTLVHWQRKVKKILLCFQQGIALLRMRLLHKTSQTPRQSRGSFQALIFIAIFASKIEFYGQFILVSDTQSATIVVVERLQKFCDQKPTRLLEKSLLELRTLKICPSLKCFSSG